MHGVCGCVCVVTHHIIGASLSKPHTSESKGGFHILYIIGVSVSKPHTSELNWDFSLLSIFFWRTSFCIFSRL